jgi:signal transduction histidine kinase
MSPSVLNQIFIPFFTTKDRGTGLGLALCHRIIQHHGGHIEVRSIEAPARDHGATFIIRLPALTRRDKPTTLPPESPPPTTKAPQTSASTS